MAKDFVIWCWKWMRNCEPFYKWGKMGLSKVYITLLLLYFSYKCFMGRCNNYDEYGRKFECGFGRCTSMDGGGLEIFLLLFRTWDIDFVSDMIKSPS